MTEHIGDLSNQEKLEEIYKMTFENNKILKGILRREKFATVMRVFYWLVILGTLGGVYLYIKPLIGIFTGSNSNISNQIDQVRQNLPDTKIFNSFMQNIKSPTQ